MNYPKKSKRDKYREDLKTYIIDLECLFDIFRHDATARQKQEEECRLRMTEIDYQCYENQKTLRTGRCLPKEFLHESDMRYKKRIDDKEKAASKEMLRVSAAATSTSRGTDASSEADPIANDDPDHNSDFEMTDSESQMSQVSKTE